MFEHAWFEKFVGNPPVSKAEIEKFRESSNVNLPADYFQFFQFMNGGEGFIGTAYIRLYKLEELLEVNVGYEFPRYHPGYFLIGSDGGGEAFALAVRTDPQPVFMIPFVGHAANAVRVGASFSNFLQSLATPGFDPREELRSCD